MTRTQPNVIARGRLVILREKHLDDAERDYSWRRDPELAEYDAARPISMSLRSFVQTVSDELEHPSPYRRTYAIEDPATGTHIGNVMYYGYERERQQTELGITIGNRDYWSQGYGTDAIRTMLGVLFDELRVHRVYLHTLTWNDRAQVAFKRVGFRDTGQVHRAGYDFIRMEVSRDEFDTQRAAAGAPQSEW